MTILHRGKAGFPYFNPKYLPIYTKMTQIIFALFRKRLEIASYALYLNSLSDQSCFFIISFQLIIDLHNLVSNHLFALSLIFSINFINCKINKPVLQIVTLTFYIAFLQYLTWKFHWKKLINKIYSLPYTFSYHLYKIEKRPNLLSKTMKLTIIS